MGISFKQISKIKLKIKYLFKPKGNCFSIESRPRFVAVVVKGVDADLHKGFEALDDDGVGQGGLPQSGEGGEVGRELGKAPRVDKLEPVRRVRPLVLQ